MKNYLFCVINNTFCLSLLSLFNKIIHNFLIFIDDYEF